MNIAPIIVQLLQITLPFIQQLIESKVVPTLKRKAYQVIDRKADNLIEDLAQNAGKIATEKNPVKKLAFIEGTKLGVETLKAIAEKLIKASNEIEKAVV